MSDTRCEQLIDIIKREFMGPDPVQIDGMIQENGEEILSSDPPRIRYSAGILFPRKVVPELAEIVDVEVDMQLDNELKQEDTSEKESDSVGGRAEYLQDAEEFINRSNAYQQSAMSITLAIADSDKITVSVSVGRYNTIKFKDAATEKESQKYFREQLIWNNNNDTLLLPDRNTGIASYDISINNKSTALRFDITYRYCKNGVNIYTFTIENVKECEGSIRDEDCYFQVGFNLFSAIGFRSLPDSEKIMQDEDFLSNQLLYRDVKNYAIGHGCTANWTETEGEIYEIHTDIFPEYEIKPIVPSSIPGVSFEMFDMSEHGDINTTVKQLELLCDKYREWINSLKLESQKLEVRFKETASQHIENCELCLKRMLDGITLIKNDKTVQQAFQFMNSAMLLQQLHYNIPLKSWIDDGCGSIVLEQGVKTLPNILDKSTWGENAGRFGKWRPFQLAFILINLHSMSDKNSTDRNIVDLIWFPTGGGKTEAYLGLSAYTIFIRRIQNKDDAGTAILMRYTLRLLTAQQYERASSMICACDIIRKEYQDLLGTSRISIGLWVGGDSTPNKTADAVKAYDKLYKNGNENPFVILKCPWCGAQMGAVRKNDGTFELPGYKKVKSGKFKVVFQCRNTLENCDFSKEGFELPLYIVDEDIYDLTPTLLLGTVDKFAMLPFLPEAQKIFGIENGVRRTAPELIIQDELHLISGPLGSMVGHYETMITELCTDRRTTEEIRPKIIASTATISRAKEQCHALYGCLKENVKQFPPNGLNAGESFFAFENKQGTGRRYVGIFAAASSSNATTTIRMYAALLYAAKALSVDSESMRDPYWTNVGYFNSIRELGQTETWIRADIDEYLQVIYKRRYEDQKEGYRENRRYIWRDEELTSRIRSDKIPFSLQNLGIKYPTSEGEKRPVDICLATNMISVGVDVPRLGLMTVSGQPKTTSEYIQATSRVGRDANAPGIVFTIYNTGRPRDKSHYEHFREYHSKIYCSVEPTSVTPFSAPLRERALHAIIIGLYRLRGNDLLNENPPKLPSEQEVNNIKSIIRRKVSNTDLDELDSTLAQIDEIIDSWETWRPKRYQDFTGREELPLMYQSGKLPNEAWGTRGFKTPTSMRNVDASCEAYVLENRYVPKED